MPLPLYIKRHLNYLILVLLLFGCQQPARTNEITATSIEGTIYLVGNEPFTELAIETKEEDVYTLRGRLVTELKGLQGQRVTLQGKVIKGEDFLYSQKGFLVEGYDHKPVGGEIDEKNTP